MQTDTEVLRIRFRERYEFLQNACSQFACADPNRVPEITTKTGGLLEVWMKLIPEENVQPYKRLLRKERFSSLEVFFTDYMKLVDNTLQLNESAIAFQYAFATPRRSGASISFLDQYPDDDDDQLAEPTTIMVDDYNYSAIDEEDSVNELGKSSYSVKPSDFTRPKVCDELLFGHGCPGPPSCRFEHGKAAISAARQWYLDKLQTDPKASQSPWSHSSKPVADYLHKGSSSAYRQNPGVQPPWKKHGDVAILSANKTEPLVEDENASAGGTSINDSRV